MDKHFSDAEVHYPRLKLKEDLIKHQWNCKTTKVIPYDNPTLSRSVGEDVELETVTSWNMKEKLGRELILTNGIYRCPQTLRFADNGLNWD